MDAHVTRGGRSPGSALIHPCPRQFVIQPMLQSWVDSRASDVGSNRRQCHRAAALFGAILALLRSLSALLRALWARAIHPFLGTCRARLGIAINHRIRTRIQSTTRSTSRIRWFLRSIPEPVEYSQYAMLRHSRRIARSTSVQLLNVVFPVERRHELSF